MSKDLKDVSESSKCTEVGERGAKSRPLDDSMGHVPEEQHRGRCAGDRAGVLRIHLETDNMCPVAIVWAFNFN